MSGRTEHWLLTARGRARIIDPAVEEASVRRWHAFGNACDLYTAAIALYFVAQAARGWL